MKKQFRSFEDARKFVHKQNILSQNQWREYYKSDNKPNDIPSAPDNTYKKDWISWGDWLGTNSISAQKKHYLKFSEARKYAHSLNLPSTLKWIEWCKSGGKPGFIPFSPNIVYKKEWKSMSDWLGTDVIATHLRKYLSYNESKKIVKTYQFKNQKEFRKFQKLNKLKNIPANPNKVYKQEWKGWGDFLGHGKLGPIDIANQRYSFKKARDFVRSLKLKNYNEWKEWYKSEKRPISIPTAPDRVYKNSGWIDWNDFLGSDIVSNMTKSKNWLPWLEAKKLYQKIKLENNMKNLNDWEQYVKTHKLPKGLPSYPAKIYTKGKILRNLKNEKTI